MTKKSVDIMSKLLIIRNKIYDYFQNSGKCQTYFYSDDKLFSAYYTAMYLLADTAESLIAHRASGFSENFCAAYIEFLGVMQAIIVQQDSIMELYKAITGQELNRPDKWKEIRNLRNIYSGHPVNKTDPLRRSFLSRQDISYRRLICETWTYKNGASIMESIQHPEVLLGELLDAYTREATIITADIFIEMKKKWPNNKLRNKKPVNRT